MPIIGPGGGGGSFTGGTVPNATTFDDTVTVTPPTTHKGLVITGVDGDTTRLLDLSALHTGLTLDSDGSFIYTSDDIPELNVHGVGTRALFVVDDTLNKHKIQAATEDGAGLEVFYAGGIIFQVAKGATSTTARVLTKLDAPATATLSSGTGAQIDGTADRRTYTPVTFNPTAGAAATCAVAVSPDGVTYTALWTETEPAGIGLDGTIHGINVFVPAIWRLKLTVTNATIGTTTYY